MMTNLMNQYRDRQGVTSNASRANQRRCQCRFRNTHAKQKSVSPRHTTTPTSSVPHFSSVRIPVTPRPDCRYITNVQEAKYPQLEHQRIRSTPKTRRIRTRQFPRRHHTPPQFKIDVDFEFRQQPAHPATRWASATPQKNQHRPLR